MSTAPPVPASPPRAVIVANGTLGDAAAARALIRPDDRLIAADGGVHHCQAMGLRPHVLIGDFDSLDPGTLADLERQGVTLQAHPARKDETDIELAVRYALAQGWTDIVVLAALGGRWDQTLANLLLPALPDFASASIRLMDGGQQIALVRGQAAIEGQPGDVVSLVALGGDARGITTHGLEYPLHDDALAFGSTRGISNVLLGARARVEVKDGLLLCVLIAASPGAADPSRAPATRPFEGGFE